MQSTGVTGPEHGREPQHQNVIAEAPSRNGCPDCGSVVSPGESALRTLTLRECLVRLLHTSPSDLTVYRLMSQLKGQWRRLYTSYEAAHQFRAYVPEPSVLPGGSSRSMRALPGHVALHHVSQWIPDAFARIHERDAQLVAMLASSASVGSSAQATHDSNSSSHLASLTESGSVSSSDDEYIW